MKTTLSFKAQITVAIGKIKAKLGFTSVTYAEKTIQTSNWDNFVQAIEIRGLYVHAFDRGYQQSLLFIINENGKQGELTIRYTPEALNN